MNVTLRPMRRNDKSAIMEILRHTPEFNNVDVDIAEEVIDVFLEDPAGSGYNVTVAELDTKPVGYISYGLTPLTVSTWDVYWIVVSPEEKGHGIGSRLLSESEDRIKAGGGYLIMIETSGKPEYENTRRFYESRNYRVAYTIRDFYAPGDDIVSFEKRFPIIQEK
jgi:ribosomal protein S18 acetylase RimI-like enzyme